MVMAKPASVQMMALIVPPRSTSAKGGGGITLDVFIAPFGVDVLLAHYVSYSGIIQLQEELRKESKTYRSFP
jgi:hypothetical protein